MTKEQRIESAEHFVRRVLSETFKQPADAETIRAVAMKVSEAVNVKPKVA